MPLSQPTSEDTRKLHAEINQTVNQRFLLTLAAITMFGVITGWTVAQPGPVGPMAFVASILLAALLFALFLVAHFLRGMLRVFSAYLRKTESSGWEWDWKRYRDTYPGYYGYTKPLGVVFLFLGVANGLFPLTLAAVVDLDRGVGTGLAIGLASAGTVLYLILVWGMSFRDWYDRERNAEESWKALNE